jgi:tetratricopeptide (TPR) repeat protein
MTSKIHGLSLSSISLPQFFKQPDRLTIIFGAILLAAIALITTRSLMHRVSAAAPQPAEDPNKEIRSLYEGGLKKLKENKTAEAEADFNQALEKYNSKLPDDFRQTNEPLLSGQIYYQLAVCMERKGDFEKAHEKYAEALSLTKGLTIHAEISLKKGMLLEIQNKELEESLAIYNQVIAATDRGQTPDLRLYTLACLLKSHALLRKEPQGQSLETRKEALEYAESAGRSAKEAKDLHLITEALYQQGLCNHLLGHYEIAKKKYAFALFLVENPYTKANILCDRALLKEQYSFFRAALNDYNEALKCEFTPEHFLGSRQFLYRASLKNGASASFKNSEELKNVIKASKERLERRGIFE